MDVKHCMNGRRSITNFFPYYVQVRQKLTQRGYALWFMKGKPIGSSKTSKQRVMYNMLIQEKTLLE